MVGSYSLANSLWVNLMVKADLPTTGGPTTTNLNSCEGAADIVTCLCLCLCLCLSSRFLSLYCEGMVVLAEACRANCVYVGRENGKCAMWSTEGDVYL